MAAIMSFDSCVRRFLARSEPKEIADAIRQNGCAIIEELAPIGVVQAVEAELSPYIQQVGFGDSAILGHLTRRVGSIIARAPSARALITNPVLLAIVRDILGDASNFQLSLAESIYLWPGSRAQFLHQDEMAFGQFDFGAHEVQVSTLWALSDYTEQMGATRVVPQSHRVGAGKQYLSEDTIAAEMPRGSVLVYSGKIYHGSGDNRSNAIRKALNVDYAVGWLRQEENQYLSCPREIARTLPEDLLRLMGYKVSQGCGWTGDRHDPLGAVLLEYDKPWSEPSVLP